MLRGVAEFDNKSLKFVIFKTRIGAGLQSYAAPHK
jgi:hypothetical protein